MAHVMTYKEIIKVQKGQSVFEELHHIKYKIHKLIFNGVDFTDTGDNFMRCSHYLCVQECDEDECPDYNWNYRVWDEMPTQEEMDNVPWKDDPYV